MSHKPYVYYIGMEYLERKAHIRTLASEQMEEFLGLPENWSLEARLRFVFERGYRDGFVDGVEQAFKTQKEWDKG